MIAVLIPALDRPMRVGPLSESLRSASRTDPLLLYLVSQGDEKTVSACRAHEVKYVVTPFPLEGGDYARKINLGIEITTEAWIFQAGDDIRFHTGWDERVLEFAAGHPQARVIGTNDLGNPLVRQGAHSTHSLISREYIEEYGTIDEPGKALHEGYWHCWVDNELIETAKARKVYWSDRKCIVEHLHHIWPVSHGSRERKGKNDETYRRGQLRYHEDHMLFLTRRPLWRRGKPL